MAQQQATIDPTDPSTAQPRAMMAPAQPDPAVVEAMRTCEFGGPSHSPLQLTEAERSACGCGNRELYECRAGKGRVLGRVTTTDCYACREAFLASQASPA